MLQVASIFWSLSHKSELGLVLLCMEIVVSTAYSFVLDYPLVGWFLPVVLNSFSGSSIIPSPVMYCISAPWKYLPLDFPSIRTFIIPSIPKHSSNEQPCVALENQNICRRGTVLVAAPGSVVLEQDLVRFTVREKTPRLFSSPKIAIVLWSGNHKTTCKLYPLYIVE